MEPEDDIDVALENLVRPKQCIILNADGRVSLTTVKPAMINCVELSFCRLFSWEYHHELHDTLLVITDHL